MIKSSLNIKQTLFVVVLSILALFPSVELAILISLIIFVAVLFKKNLKIDTYTFNLITLLSLIVIIGLFLTFFNNYKLFDIVRDLSHFTKPILTLLGGYFLAKFTNDNHVLIKGIIIVALLLALKHIITVGLSIDFYSINIDKMRHIGGYSSLIEMLGLLFLLLSNKISLFKVINGKLYRQIAIAVILFSFILYFSRTMLLGLIILYLAMLGRTKLNPKGLKYVFIFSLISLVFYGILINLKLDPDKPGLQSFFYKIRNAPSEVFSSPENYDPREHKRIFDKWRAYEAKMALDQLDGHIITGKGFGALIDLKFVAPLNDKGMQFIPLTHNGYVYVLFKTGLFGLLIYVIFLISLYAQSYKLSYSLEEQAIRNLISGFGIYYILTSLIITGIYNLEELLSFILGISLWMLANSREKLKING